MREIITDYAKKSQASHGQGASSMSLSRRRIASAMKVWFFGDNAENAKLFSGCFAKITENCWSNSKAISVEINPEISPEIRIDDMDDIPDLRSLVINVVIESSSTAKKVLGNVKSVVRDIAKLKAFTTIELFVYIYDGDFLRQQNTIVDYLNDFVTDFEENDSVISYTFLVDKRDNGGRLIPIDNIFSTIIYSIIAGNTEYSGNGDQFKSITTILKNKSSKQNTIANVSMLVSKTAGIDIMTRFLVSFDKFSDLIIENLNGKGNQGISTFVSEVVNKSGEMLNSKLPQLVGATKYLIHEDFSALPQTSINSFNKDFFNGMLEEFYKENTWSLLDFSLIDSFSATLRNYVVEHGLVSARDYITKIKKEIKDIEGEVFNNNDANQQIMSDFLREAFSFYQRKLLSAYKKELAERIKSLLEGNIIERLSEIVYAVESGTQAVREENHNSVLVDEIERKTTLAFEDTFPYGIDKEKMRETIIDRFGLFDSQLTSDKYIRKLLEYYVENIRRTVIPDSLNYMNNFDERKPEEVIEFCSGMFRDLTVITNVPVMTKGKTIVTIMDNYENNYCLMRNMADDDGTRIMSGIEVGGAPQFTLIEYINLV